MMHFMNNSLGTNGSPIFSINKLSPYLSPMLNDHSRKNSIGQEQQLIAFNLQQPDDSRMPQQPIKIQYLPLQIPQVQQNSSSQIQHHKRKSLKRNFEHSQPSSQIQSLIEYLVENIGLSEQYLLERGRSISDQNKLMGEVYMVLMRKFKKLKKTKEQITKYCMRKAFKFISDKIRRQKNNFDSKDVDECLKNYFQKNQLGTSFSIPFKKNSSQKTMNTAFLKKVFSSKGFLEDYRLFLVHFKQMMEEDNQKKIKYLADLIEQYTQLKSIKKVEGIKRLPWTRIILDKTQELSQSLISHADLQI